MTANIKYNPEKFGLTEVGEVEFSSASYEFDTFVVWKDDAGKFYWAQDSGCSCPYPFEDIGLSDTKSGTWGDMKVALDEAVATRRGYGASQDEVDADVARLMEKATA